MTVARSEAVDVPKACGTRGVSCHGVFGMVIDGFDVLLSIRAREPTSDPEPGDKIITVEIEAG